MLYILNKLNGSCAAAAAVIWLSGLAGWPTACASVKKWPNLISHIDEGEREEGGGRRDVWRVGRRVENKYVQFEYFRVRADMHIPVPCILTVS